MSHKIVKFFPQFTSIPPFDSSTFEPFCWSELLLYKPFHSIPRDIGTTSCEIVSHWHHIKGTYGVWNIKRVQEEPSTPPSDDLNFDPIPFPFPHTMDEWELLSQI